MAWWQRVGVLPLVCLWLPEQEPKSLEDLTGLTALHQGALDLLDASDEEEEGGEGGSGDGAAPAGDGGPSPGKRAGAGDEEEGDEDAWTAL